jgi:hypothetical protein
MLITKNSKQIVWRFSLHQLDSYILGQCMVNLNRDLIMQLTNITQQQRKATLVPITRGPPEILNKPPPLLNKPGGPPPTILNKPPPKRVNIQLGSEEKIEMKEEKKVEIEIIANEEKEKITETKSNKRKSQKRMSISLKSSEPKEKKDKEKDNK